VNNGDKVGHETTNTCTNNGDKVGHETTNTCTNNGDKVGHETTNTCTNNGDKVGHSFITKVCLENMKEINPSKAQVKITSSV
jgi:hypothetical protein